MSRTKKIIAGILILVVIAVAIWAVLTWRIWKAEQIAPPIAPEASLSAAPAVPAAPGVGVAPDIGAAVASPPEAVTVEAMARSFTERFGSYSNQSNFENITDLYPFMTEKMRAWAEDFIAQARAKRIVGASYFGITTKALGGTILSQDENSIVIKVPTSRRESTETELNKKVYFQDIELSLVKENDLWKVDRAEWK